jgi:predicted transcriptional regulator
MRRRPDGALEHDVMEALWRLGGASSAAEVNAELGGCLAHTTVATVLGRLHAKGWVERIEGRRAHRYVAALTESDLVAQRISEALGSAGDRKQVLARFVGSLSKRDRRALVKLLAQESP